MLAFIWRYSQPGHPPSQIGLISTFGALGLAFGQCVNCALLFRIGSHRMFALASGLLVLLIPFSLFFQSFFFQILARFALGATNGMIFLVVENALVLFSPPKIRSSVLSAYLFTLYSTALLAPFLGSQILAGNSAVVVGLILSAAVAPIAFWPTPLFLENQSPSSDWSLGEWHLVGKSPYGFFLCALSGAVLPLWTSFLPSMIQPWFPLYTTTLATLFFCGGLLGQIFVMALQGQISPHRLTAFFLNLGLLAGLGLMTPLAASLPVLAMLLATIGFAIFPLYGLGVDLALAQIPQNLWVRANKTLLSSYTIPAILSPLMIPFAPSPLSWTLPLLSTLGFACAHALGGDKSYKRIKWGNMQKNEE